MIATSMGKRLRMRRIFRDGKAIVLPLDHPIYLGPAPGLEDPARVVALGREHGATAVLITAGALRRAADEIGDMGVLMRVDATVSHLGGSDSIMHLFHDVRQAAMLGADMVVVNCYVGIGDPRAESELLQKMARVSAQCEKMGMPMCGEILPRLTPAGGAARTMPTSEDLGLAIRLGLEYGCDMVKTVYNGDPEGFARAIASGHLPVIMAGGPKRDDETSIFRQTKEVMTHGACGVAIGRRVWGSAKPAATLDALRAIVMDGVSAEEAIAIYREGNS